MTLFLALLRVAASLFTIFQQNNWMNEGVKRAYAEQLREINESLIKALEIQKEWNELEDDAVRKRFEAEGWFDE